MKKTILISFLCFNLLSSQFGINIYLVYCCCAKNLSYSFIPKTGSCKFLKGEKSVCGIKTCSKNPDLRKIPCGNQSIDYKSLNAKAEKPSQTEFAQTNPGLASVNSWSIPDLKSKLPKSITPDIQFIYYTGYQYRKLYCSLTC